MELIKENAEGSFMKKKVCLVITIFAVIALLTGIPHLVYGIQARGIDGVNYGRVIFPLLIGIIAFYMYKKQE